MSVKSVSDQCSEVAFQKMHLQRTSFSPPQALLSSFPTKLPASSAMHQGTTLIIEFILALALWAGEEPDLPLLVAAS